jgi:WD40 repeat protein
MKECQSQKSSKIGLIKNKNVNETEWKPNLMKSFKCLHQTLCASYCMKSIRCNLTVFSSTNTQCNHYSGQITNQIELIDSVSTNLLYNFKPPAYDLKGVLNKTIIDNQASIRRLRVLKNGNLVSGSSNGSIQVWNYSSKDWPMIASWQAHVGIVGSILILDDSKLVTCGDDKLIKIWSSINYTLIRNLTAHPSWVYSLASFSNGFFASGYSDKTFKIWNPNDGSLISTKSAGHLIGSLIVLDNQDICTGGDDFKINIWNYADLSLKATLSGHTGQISSLAKLQNGYLASGSADNRIIIWDLNSYSIKQSFIAHNSWIFHIIELQNGDLASASGDRSIKIWTYSSQNVWTCKYTLLNHSNEVLSLAQSQNGYLVSGSADKTIKIWS